MDVVGLRVGDDTPLQRMLASPQYRDGRFVNPLPVRNGLNGEGHMSWTVARRWLTGSEVRIPEQALPVLQRQRADFAAPAGDGLRLTWLGHSFSMALHAWTEPVERLLVAAQAGRVAVAIPRPGQSVEPGSPAATVRWWPTVAWQTAGEAPVVSSGMVDSASDCGPTPGQ